MKSLLLSILLFYLFVTSVFSQNLATFDQDGLKFDYPLGWTVSDKSDSKVQTLFLSKPNSTILIIVSSPRETVTTYRQYQVFQRSSLERYEKAVVKSLQTPDKKPRELGLCLDFNNRNVAGTKYLGIYNNEPATGEVYPFVLGTRFITLVYMRIDKEETISAPVWNGLIKSLYLSGSNRYATPEFISDNPGSGGILNGRALNLVRPTLAKDEYRAGNYGKVEVEVVIDENGKIISAKAVSGPKLLYDRSEYAARKSKFAPTTVCGHAVKVTGTIVYNFNPY